MPRAAMLQTPLQAPLGGHRALAACGSLHQDTESAGSFGASCIQACARHWWEGGNSEASK